MTVLLGNIFVLALLVGCQRPSVLPFQSGSGPPQSHGGPVTDHVSLVDNLRADGYIVNPVQDLQQPFLRAQGALLRISGDDLSAPADVQSYNYDDRDLGVDGSAAAQTDADQIQPDGQPKTASVTWSGPPHFFHKERVIVIYGRQRPAASPRALEVTGATIRGPVAVREAVYFASPGESSCLAPGCQLRPRYYVAVVR